MRRPEGRLLIQLAGLVSIWTGSIGCGGSSHSQGVDVPPGHVAVLQAAATTVPAGTSRDPQLIIVPPSMGAISTLQVDVEIAATMATGDTDDRAELALRFQPVADRADTTTAIYFRIDLGTGPGGVLARRYYFECLDPTCTMTTSIGTRTGGEWTSAGAIITEGTFYTASIAFDPMSKTVEFKLGSNNTTIATTTIDLLQTSTGSPTIAPPYDISNESFMRGFLEALVHGGSTGGGDGSVDARFDNVYIGTSGAAPILFDDFEAATTFDAAKWIINGTGASISSGTP